MKEIDVTECTIFECVAGSHAYGTNTVSSDIDVRGVCVPRNPTYYVGLGINKFEQKDRWENEDDKIIYDLRKIVRLMADNNPNCLELLFIDKKHHTKCLPEWQNFIDNRNLFLSKKVYFTYSGYSHSQFQRIKRHRNWILNPPKIKPERINFGLPERKIIKDDQKGAYQWLIANLIKDTVEYTKLSEKLKNELRNVNFIGCIQNNIPNGANHILKEMTGATDEWIDIMCKEKHYHKSLNDWNSYQSWKNNRNPVRKEMEEKFGFDGKHASHLVRIMRQGIEILKGEGLKVYRDDAEELLAIRNGKWSYDHLAEQFEKYKKQMSKLYITSSLPKEPNKIKIDKMCQKTIINYVFT